MAKTELNYESELNADILLMAADQVAEDLSWQVVDASPPHVKLKTPPGYAKHDMTFEVTVTAAGSMGTRVNLQGHMSGLFSDKSQLESEIGQFKNRLEAKGQEITQEAIAEGYMCPNCGALVTVGNLACEKCGTTLPRPSTT